MKTSTTEFFGLADRNTGQLAHLRQQDWECRDAYMLTRDESCPLFKADSLEQLADVLFDDTPGYNTNEKLPGWGEFREGQLVPVKVCITVQAEPVAIPRTVKFKTIEIRSIPDMVARGYAGAPIVKTSSKEGLLYFWLVELPEGETLETIKDLVGATVYGNDRWSKRHLYAVAPVPEEYEPLTQGRRACALLIAGATC